MYTLYDLVARVLDARDGFNDLVSERRALRAAVWGADQVTQRHAWKDFHTESTHYVNAPVEATGSVTEAGLVTLTVGTFPAWTEQASLKIDNRLYVISDMLTSTTATIENYTGPAVASQAVTIVHDRLVILDNVRKIYAIRNTRDDIEMIFASPSCMWDHQIQQNATPGDPSFVTSVQQNLPGSRRTEIRMSPPPSTALTMRVSYYRFARRAEVMHDCGFVTIDAGDLPLVTMTKPVKVREWQDLILVLSENENRPDAELGFSVADANPSIAELDVASILTTTTVRLVADYAAIAGKGAIITQRIDLPPHAWEAAAMYAEAKYLQIGNGSHGDFWQTIQMADAELRTAMEQESIFIRDSAGSSRTATYTRPENIVMVDP